MIVGLALLFSGIGLFSGKILARTVGVIAASISLIVNFFFISAQPLWALIIITLDVLVIWAITAHGSEMKHLGDVRRRLLPSTDRRRLRHRRPDCTSAWA